MPDQTRPPSTAAAPANPAASAGRGVAAAFGTHPRSRTARRAGRSPPRRSRTATRTASRTACPRAGTSRRDSRGARWPRRRSGRRARRRGSCRSSRGTAAASAPSRRSARAMMLIAIATGISTIVRVPNCREIESIRRVCSHSTMAQATKPTSRLSASTSANRFDPAGSNTWLCPCCLRWFRITSCPVAEAHRRTDEELVNPPVGEEPHRRHEGDEPERHPEHRQRGDVPRHRESGA